MSEEAAMAIADRAHGGPLTYPARFAAWVLVRLRSLPPGLAGGSWAAVWRAAAHIYRERAINTMQGLRMAQQDIRALQRAFDEKDDMRPLAGGELDEYVQGLRERCESLWMQCVDAQSENASLRNSRGAVAAENERLRRRLAQAEADAAALREALTKIADNAECQVGHWDEWRCGRFARTILEVDHPGDALLAELRAARALADRLNDRRGICPLCGFGKKLDGSEFHGTDCELAAYNAVRKENDT